MGKIKNSLNGSNNTSSKKENNATDQSEIKAELSKIIMKHEAVDNHEESDSSASQSSESDNENQEQTTSNQNDYSDESESEEEEEHNSSPDNNVHKVATSEEEEAEVSSSKVEAANVTESTKKEPRIQENHRDDERDSRTIFIGNIPNYVTKAVLLKLCSKFGGIETVILKNSRSLRFAHVVFNNMYCMEKALILNGMIFKGNHLAVRNVRDKHVNTKKTVLIKYNFEEVTFDQIWSAFEAFGVVQNVFNLVEFALITFKSSKSVETAVQNGEVTIGDKKYHISKVKKQDVPERFRMAAPKFNLDKLQTVFKEPTKKSAQREKLKKPPQGKHFQPRKRMNYHNQQGGPTNNYNQQRGPRNNYSQQGGPRNNSNQQVRPRNDFNRQPGPKNYYNQQPRPFKKPHQPRNNFNGHPGQFRSHQGRFGPRHFQQHQQKPNPRFEDVIGSGLAVHRRKLDPNAFTISFLGNTFAKES